MRKRLPFGPYLPDIAPAGQCNVAINVLPADQGYVPVPAWMSITPALPGVLGGGAFVASIGTTSFLAGTPGGLYRYSGAAWVQQFAQAATIWRFAQFGDHAVAVNGGAPVAYDLVAGSAAAVGGNPPAADLVATVRDFVVLAGAPTDRLRVSWSGLNNLNQWNSTDNQADSQQMLDGGEVMGLAGGEYGVIVQRQAVKRMSYVEGEIIFQFDTISSNIGCMSKGSVVQAGRQVFFLSERGFQVTDGNDVRPIGAQKVDRTFFGTYSRQDIEAKLSSAVDPRRNLAMWAMPGAPGTIWCYDWTLDRWSTISMPVSVVFSGFTANVSIDALDALYGNLDLVPVSLDDASLSGGNPLLLIADPNGAIGSLSGTAMDGTIGLSRFELSDGRARLRTLRPITDAPVVMATIGGSPRADDRPVNEVAMAMRANGDIPCRVNAREFTPQLTFSGAWTYATAVDVEWESGGRR